MRNFWRIVTWIGVAFILGPGTSIPNDFDMIFQIAGLFLVVVGTIGVLLSGRVTRPTDE